MQGRIQGLPIDRYRHLILALDLFFIDRDGLTVRIEREVPPGRVLFERSADRVLELPSTAR